MFRLCLKRCAEINLIKIKTMLVKSVVLAVIEREGITLVRKVLAREAITIVIEQKTSTAVSPYNPSGTEICRLSGIFHQYYSV